MFSFKAVLKSPRLVSSVPMKSASSWSRSCSVLTKISKSFLRFSSSDFLASERTWCVYRRKKNSINDVVFVPKAHATKLSGMSPRSNRKPALGHQSTAINHVTLMSYMPVIWSRDTGQRITWFDRYQLIITWCLISKKYTVNQGCLSLSTYYSMAAILRDSVVIVVRTRPRAIPLAMISMRKSTYGFPFLSYMTMEFRLAVRQAAGARL